MNTRQANKIVKRRFNAWRERRGKIRWENQLSFACFLLDADHRLSKALKILRRRKQND